MLYCVHSEHGVHIVQMSPFKKWGMKMKKVIQVTEIDLLNNARHLGMNYCVVFPSGIVLAVGTCSLILEMKLEKHTFKVSEVLDGFERIERNGESNEVVLYDRREKVKA